LPLNVDLAQDTLAPSIANVGGTPWVAWSEDSPTAYLLRVAQFTGTGWSQVGGTLNISTTQDARGPSIANVGGTPYVAWREHNSTAGQVRVDRFSGGSWNAVGGSLNFDANRFADDPSIADVGGTPYVTWHESTATVDQIRVARLVGSSFSIVGGSLNFNAAKAATHPRIADAGGTPYVAWEEAGTSVDQIRAAKLVGSTWTAVGGPLNFDPAKFAREPSIADVGGTPFVTWRETNGTADQVRVAQLSGAAWSAVGGSLNLDGTQNASQPDIAGVGGAPFVAWREPVTTATVVRAARFSGGTWSPVDGTLNVDQATDGYNPDIADVGGTPYVARQESGTTPLARVTRLEPDFLSYSSSPTATGASLSTTVRDFGLPLQIGFELGSQAPVLASSGAGTDTVTASIGGLTPGTAYSWRPFGTDGTHRTSIGDTQTFTTGLLPDTTPPGFTIRGFPSRIKRKTLLKKGLRGRLTPTEAVSFVLDLVGARKRAGAQITRVRSVVIAHESLKRAAGTRRVTLKVKRGVKRRLGKGKLTLRITATDAAGNKKVKRRTIRVR
jgi:hypothetical protein